MFRRLGNFLYNALSRLLGIHPSVGKLIRGSLQLSNPDSAHFPAENLPMASRVIATGMWNYVFFQFYRQFAGPYWVERQYDPNDPSFIPRSSSLVSINLTHRTWMAFRSVHSSCFSLVDPAGSISPVVGYYSLEFALRHKDRIYLPTRREPVIHQYLRDNTPVPITEYEYRFGRIRVTGSGSEDSPDTISILIEYDMDTREETDFVIGIRPFNTEGAALIHEMSLRQIGSEFEILINGKAEILLHDEPSETGFSNLEEGDAYFINGHANGVLCSHGISTGRIVYPLRKSGRLSLTAKCYAWDGSTPSSPPPSLSGRHGSSLRWNVRSLTEHYRSQIRPRRHRKKTGESQPWPGNKTGDARSARRIDEQIQKNVVAWKSIQNRGATFHCAKSSWNDLAQIMVSYLVSLQTDETITPGAYTYRQFWYRDATYLLHALTLWNYGDLARKVLSTYPRLQERNGFFKSHAGEWDSNGQAIWSLVRHAEETGDNDLIRESYSAIVKGVKWILRMRKKGFLGKLLPAGFSAEHLGPADHYYWDNFWSLAGLQKAAKAAQILGKKEDEKFFLSQYASYADDIVKISENDRKTFGVITAGPARTSDSGMIGSVVVLYPLELDLFSHEEMENTANSIYNLYFQKDLFFHPIIHSGFNIYLSLQVAQSLFRLGNVRLARRIFKRALESRTELWTYPEAIHPGTGGGVMGDGFHGWAYSEMLLLLREFVIHPNGEELKIFHGLRSGEIFGADLHFGPFPLRGEHITITGSLAPEGGTLRLECTDLSKTGIRVWKIRLPARLRKKSIAYDRSTKQEIERDQKGDLILTPVKNIYEIRIEPEME